MAVITNEALKEEFLAKNTAKSVNICFAGHPENVPPDTDIVVDLLFEHSPERVLLLKQFLPNPVLINAVTDTLHSIGQPFIRINAWPTFLKRHITEVVALPGQQAIAQAVFEQLGWGYRLVPDWVGMISARIVCTIINEAYYTAADQVSNKDGIDTAMKLGTHYPYGPFEWSQKIGLKNIHTLLTELCKEKNLYEVSTLLTADIKNQYQ